MKNCTKQDIIWLIQARIQIERKAIREHGTFCYQGISAYSYICGFLSAMHYAGKISFIEQKSWETATTKYMEMVHNGEENARFDY